MHNKEGSHNFTNTSGTGNTNSNNNTGATSGKNSPSASFVSNQGSIKDDESNLDGNISYHSRVESPPSKRRKRNIPPATSNTESNPAASHSSGW